MKANKLFGIIALVAVIGFAMTAVGCGNDSTDDNDGNGGGGGGGSGGTFTLTGIPSQYNGKYAGFTGSDGASSYMLYGGQSINATAQTGTGVLISNGNVSIPMWKVDINNNVVRYSGNGLGSGVVLIFNTQNFTGSEDGIALIGFENFTFTNGSATRTWSQGTEDW